MSHVYLVKKFGLLFDRFLRAFQFTFIVLVVIVKQVVLGLPKSVLEEVFQHNRLRVVHTIARFSWLAYEVWLFG